MHLIRADMVTDVIRGQILEVEPEVPLLRTLSRDASCAHELPIPSGLQHSFEWGHVASTRSATLLMAPVSGQSTCVQTSRRT